ncbi:MAG: hypothetical protein KAV87_04360 [Desulfobacteraceae bacterium]|nr:hypothetical protein [Desulfobacteraceae bacterium]
MNALTIVNPARLAVFGPVLDLLMSEKVIDTWFAISMRARKEMAQHVEDRFKNRVFYPEEKYFHDSHSANDYLHSLISKYQCYNFGTILAAEKHPYFYFPNGVSDMADMIKGVETIMKDNGIDIIISDYPASAIDVTAYQLAKSQQFPTIIINGFRTGGRLFFNYEPEKGLKEYIAYHYQKYRAEGIPGEKRRKAEQYLAFFRKTQYKSSVYQFTIPKKRHIFKEITGKKLISLVSDLIFSPGLFASRLERQLNYIKLRKNWDKIFVPLDEMDRIIFFPIHFQPEASTYLKCPYYRNQYSVIENLCICMPAGYTLYVKEHGRHIWNKPPSFFREYTEKFPNLKFVDLATDSHTLIKQSKLVVVLSSTVGWEAFLYGVPVLQFGNAFFKEFRGIYKFRSYEELGKQINDIITNHQPDMEEILTAIAAVFSGTIPGYINDPSLNPRVISKDNIRKIADTVIKGIEFYPEWQAFKEKLDRNA